MQPTKLPDDLFPSVPEWAAADYAGRVALLIEWLIIARSEAQAARDACDLFASELRTVREVNAQLVGIIESTGGTVAAALTQK